MKKKITFWAMLLLFPVIASAQVTVWNTPPHTPSNYPPKGGNPADLLPPQDPPITDDFYMIGVCRAPSGFHSNECVGQLERKCSYVNSNTDPTGGIHMDCVIVPVWQSPTFKVYQFWIHQWWIWPDAQGPCVYNPNAEDGFNPCNWGDGTCWPVNTNCLGTAELQFPLLQWMDRKKENS